MPYGERPLRPREVNLSGISEYLVSSDMPKEVLELMELFPQPVRQQQAVEYPPVPRKFKTHR
jgi:hypothetical protein